MCRPGMRHFWTNDKKPYLCKRLTGTEVEDSTLIARVKAGDRGAFNELYGIYWASLVNYAGLFVGDDGAEDVVQDVFDAEAELLEVDEVPVGDLLLIRYGVVTLDNATLPEIVARIERTYGVSLRIGAQQIPGERYNFSFQKDASVEDVVELLQFVSGCRFEIIQLNR